eukprot:UN19278
MYDLVSSTNQHKRSALDTTNTYTTSPSHQYSSLLLIAEQTNNSLFLFDLRKGNSPPLNTVTHFGT